MSEEAGWAWPMPGTDPFQIGLQSKCALWKGAQCAQLVFQEKLEIQAFI